MYIHVYIFIYIYRERERSGSISVMPNVLQRVAVCCSALQCHSMQHTSCHILIGQVPTYIHIHIYISIHIYRAGVEYRDAE